MIFILHFTPSYWIVQFTMLYELPISTNRSTLRSVYYLDYWKLRTVTKVVRYVGLHKTRMYPRFSSLHISITYADNSLYSCSITFFYMDVSRLSFYVYFISRDSIRTRPLVGQGHIQIQNVDEIKT